MHPGWLYLKKDNEKAEQLPAIIQQGKGYFCSRCGNNKHALFGEIPCFKCGKLCQYCRNCLALGCVKSCDCFYYMPTKPYAKNDEKRLYWQGMLSKSQEKGSAAVVDSICRNKSLLLWAVAGSGKTEMLFQGMEIALQQGKRICLASPRVDVCVELLPRMKDAFPNDEIICLYGNTEDNFSSQQFVIATTHQLMHFYRYFDVVFIDEVDAFPYAKDPFLEYTVKKALRKDALEIYITATPELAWQAECRTGKRNHVKIPARYHRYSLPVPRLIWVGNYKKQITKGRLPAKLVEWVNKVVAAKKRSLIFFSEIKIMIDFYQLLVQQKNIKIETVHADDPNRKEKVHKLREHEVDLLLTTTILERGITFTDVQVAVLGSEEYIFTEAALVQIAGRAGRKMEAPMGDVCFFHYGISLETKRAIMHINRMNRLGKEEGLLDD